MRGTHVVLGAALALALALPAAGAIGLDVKEHTLANGMKILMVKKPGVPRVVAHVYYKVGSINERPGITGLAHLHEHMMFKGTEVMGVSDLGKDREIDGRIDQLMDAIYRERFWKTGGDPARIAALTKEYDTLVAEQKQFIVKDDLWTQYMANGGTGLNASTGNEVTGYYVTLPANKVELQMLLESDRMAKATFREFYSEKDVVMEERRLSENRPGYLFNEQVDAAFFAASPYHWSVIGWMDDLKKVSKADLVAFNRAYYIPNNAVAVYVGDFDAASIVALAEKYFGRIPKGPDVEPIRTYEPPQHAHKRLYGEGPAPTSLRMMFHTPPAGHPDGAALSVLATVLGSGRGRMFGGGGPETGRLQKLLIKEKEMAVEVSASSQSQWYVGVFELSATPRVDKIVAPDDLEKEILAVLETIKQDGVTADEIQKAKNRSEAMFVRTLVSPMGIASRIGRAELHRGWRSLEADLEALKAVTNEDVKRVAATYFAKDNGLTAVYTRKAGERRGRPEGMPPRPPAAAAPVAGGAR